MYFVYKLKDSGEFIHNTLSQCFKYDIPKRKNAKSEKVGLTEFPTREAVFFSLKRKAPS